MERESESGSDDMYSPIVKKEEDGTDRFGCRLCSRTLASRNSFGLHIRRHKEEKTKVCKFCGKAFHTGQELKSHERTHTGERPYKCEICYSSFSHFGSALIHRKSHASRGETDPFAIVNGEIQYPPSFKKPRSNSTERKEGTGSPKRKRLKKNSGDVSSSSFDDMQDNTPSNSDQPLRRSSLDVNFEREQSGSDTGAPNRRHSLNDQVLATGNGMEIGKPAFSSPVGSSTPHYQTPSSYDNLYNRKAAENMPPAHISSPDQLPSFYGAPAGYSRTPAQNSQAIVGSGLEPSQFYTPQGPMDRDQHSFRSAQPEQDGYFSPQHQSQPAQLLPQQQQHQSQPTQLLPQHHQQHQHQSQPTQLLQQQHQQKFEYQSGSGEVAYSQRAQQQQHREPPPGYRPRVSGGSDNGGVSGQPFKSSSPSTEIVKSLLQHYNLPEGQPGAEFGHQPHYPQEQQGYGVDRSPLTYSEQPHLQQSHPVGYAEHGSTQLNYQGQNPPPYNPGVQGQQQQFYSSPQHQPPMYPGPMVNRHEHFSPQHQTQHQQKTQPQTFDPQQGPHQSPQHQVFNQHQQHQQHQHQQSPQHQVFNQHQQQHQHRQSPQHQTLPQQKQLQQQQQTQILNNQPQQNTSGMAPNTAVQSSGPQPNLAQNLQPLPKISSLARDLPRS
ncbi:hypothetical protein EGW08_021269 [Elysia chlorotica]|uniref:C2H2-type domain-containing protein n=1 Tax=Elysia chlorotica TaxID=188477 RepID=A0A3S0Z788_ELYCH|nr:hypothetical protein EGW08_021269 [Elysia chlorotica]